MINSKTSGQTFANRLIIALSAVIILTYAIRVTVIGVVIPIGVTDYLSYAVLIFGFLFVFFSPGKQVNYLGVLLLLFAFVSSVLSPYFDVALIRTVLWGLVFATVGPLFSNSVVNKFKYYLWIHSNFLIILISFLSFFWNAFGFPLYGKGMAGVTMHCMLLGAIAGIATVLSFNNLLALTTRAFFSWGVFIACALSCLISGSRSAVMSAVMGIAVVFLMKFRGTIRFAAYVVSICIASVALLSITGDGASFLGEDNDSNIYIAELTQKADSNSREQLWADRIAEFSSNPIVGVGIGVDTFSFAEQSTENRIVEPGSSYLAVLSMTGILGALSLCFILIDLFLKASRNSHLFDKNEIVKVASLGAFWGVYAVGEGWIFAGGSIICLFFWIWVGRVATFGVRDLNNFGESL